MPLNNPSDRVAAAVRAEIARRGFNGSELARQLGWSQAAVSRRLLGRVPFDVNELNAIAELLEIPMATLIGEPAAS